MGPRSRRRAPAPLLTVALLATLNAGCFTRTLRTTVYDDQRTEVSLRSQVRGSQSVARGFDHPLTIAPVRVAHILSRVDLRTEAKKGTERAPAIPLDSLYQIAEGVSKALAEAGPDQEVVVLSIRKSKRFVLFDRQYLTSFLVYAKGEALMLHFSRADWEIEVRREDRLPEPHIGEHPMKFRIIPTKAMTLVDTQSVAVDWRDPIFRKPSRTRLLPGGRVVRRTILMESPEDEFDQPLPQGTGGESLSPETLRKLADLEELRRRGEISETEYTSQRRQILRSNP